jgi:hypothetical protein
MLRKSTTQTSFYDPWFGLTDAKRERLDRSWAPLFRERILPLIDEDTFAHFYCADNGRPNASIRLLVGMLLLKEWHDLTDIEALGALEYDMRWHVALGVDPSSVSLCQKTVHNFRVHLYADATASLFFAQLTDHLSVELGIQTGKQRLDTTHILSNFARHSRLGLFCETQRVLLRALHREAESVLAVLPVSLRRRYLDDEGSNSSYDDARSSDTRRRLSVSARDAYRLREALGGVTLPSDSAEAYKNLERLVDEHCEIVASPQASAEGDADADLPPVPVIAKDAKKLTGDVLQTPHDPDVTYSGHKGQGYEALITETCDPANVVQLITHVSLERACESDADRVLPVVEALAARDIAPETLLADTAFGSVENVVTCARHGVELISPQPGNAGTEAATPTLCVQDDEFTVQLVTTQSPSTCPNGMQAFKTLLHNDPEEGPVALLEMKATSCADCPRRCWCPSITMDNSDKLIMIALKYNLPAHRRITEQTDEFKDAYRPRGGIEGTNSEMKRGQGIGKLRVRGEKRVRLVLYFKALACNIKRAVNYWVSLRTKGSLTYAKAKNHQNVTLNWLVSALDTSKRLRLLVVTYLFGA